MTENDWELHNLLPLSAAVKKASACPLFEADDVTVNAPLEQQLHALVLQNNICAAEDLLFENIDQIPPQQRMEVALQFYQDVQMLSDEQLESADFSRQEILDGLEAVHRAYGVNTEG